MSESESECDEAVHCGPCQMWVNGPTQWEDHKIGKKHAKNIKPSHSRRWKQSKVEDLPAHPFLMESMVVSTSQATAQIDDVRNNLPAGSREAADHRRGMNMKTGRRMRQRRSRLNCELDMLRISEEATEFEKRCSQCNCRIVKNRRCSGCYSVSYCSRECQNLHWRDHKKDCKTCYGMIGENDGWTLCDISESHSEDGPQPASASFIDTSFSIVLPVLEELCSVSEWTLGSDSEWTLVSDSETEPEELV